MQKSEDRQKASPLSWLTAGWCRSIEGEAQGLCLFRSDSSQNNNTKDQILGI